MKPSEYKYIRHWHVSTGSFPYYWKALQERAAREGAPLNVIYLDHNNKWITLADCNWSEDRKLEFAREANKP